MLDRIRTLDRPQYARKMHLRYITARELFIFNELNTFRTRVQLPPAPPLALPDTSGEILKARMAQALRAFLCLPLSEDIQLNPVIIGIRLGIR